MKQVKQYGIFLALDVPYESGNIQMNLLDQF